MQDMVWTIPSMFGWRDFVLCAFAFAIVYEKKRNKRKNKK